MSRTPITNKKDPKFRLVLGFEIHIELGTKSKMFCACSADHFGKPANSQVCPVCLGLPGALPVPNKTAVEWCVKLGLALNCQINLKSKFDRKNYFYPDLPKGYQISQYDQPLCGQGYLELRSGKKIGITRVHLEEDTGKLQHHGRETWIDFNRSGVPLVEIVTEPDFASSSESDEFLKEIQMIVRTLGISTADMEKGSMRLEANISLGQKSKFKGQKLPDYKVEIKNVNSFRFIKKAIEYEIERQRQLLASGIIPGQETRGWSESKGETVLQRGKEQAHDYRYFPDPDIPPLEFTNVQINTWRQELPELPDQKRRKMIEDYGLNISQASILVASPTRLTKFYELVGKHDPAEVAKTLINTPEGQVNAVTMHGTQVMRDEDKLKTAIKETINANPRAVADYKAGKQQALFFLVGQVKNKMGDIDVPLTIKIIGEMMS